MLTKSSFILDSFILPEAKNFNKLKPWYLEFPRFGLNWDIWSLIWTNDEFQRLFCRPTEMLGKNIWVSGSWAYPPPFYVYSVNITDMCSFESFEEPIDRRLTKVSNGASSRPVETGVTPSFFPLIIYSRKCYRPKSHAGMFLLDTFTSLYWISCSSPSSVKSVLSPASSFVPFMRNEDISLS